MRYSLAVLYKEQLILEDAAKNFELVIQGYTRVLGPKHWETLKASDQLEKLER